MNDDDIMMCKYRPATLSEVVGQPSIVRRLQRLAKAKKTMHMLFSGPAGVGKTSCAHAFLQDLYGPAWRDNILELNASDERGIETVRTKIQDYSKMMTMNEDVSFKVVFLDEADAMSRDAMQTLRRVMEDYSETNRFILSCNYVHKIIPPIQDRCSIFRFKKLDWGAIYQGLNRVIKTSKIQITEDDLKIIAQRSHGSMRRALNTLEDLNIGNSNISNSDVLDVVGTFHRKDLAELLKYARKQDYQNANLIYYGMKYNAISPVEIIHEFIEYIHDSMFPQSVKYKLYYLLAEVEWRISQGADDWIQFVWFLAQVKDIPTEEEMQAQIKNAKVEKSDVYPTIRNSDIYPDEDLTAEDLGIAKK